MCEKVVTIEAFEKSVQYAFYSKEHSTYRRLGIQRLEELLHHGCDKRNNAHLHYLSLQRKLLSFHKKGG